MTDSHLHRVLAATDLSPQAAPAVNRAATLARAHGAGLHVVHVIDPATDDLTPDEALAMLAAATADLEPTPTLEVRTGQPFIEILHAARNATSELIVAGARGWHADSERDMGSTAERLVRNGDRPVLVVRPESDPDDYQRILVGVDLSDYSADALRLVRTIFPMAEISAGHVCIVIGENRQRMGGATEEAIGELRATSVSMARTEVEEWLEQLDLGSVAVAVAPGWPRTDLGDLAAHTNQDLLVVGSHGMSGPRFILLGSVAQGVLRQAPCDVLVVRHDSAAAHLIAP